MKNRWRYLQQVAQGLIIAGLAGILSSCGGTFQQTFYGVTSLVSDGSVTANHLDANLKNGWGIAFNPKGVVWVADNGSSVSTLYDGNGVPQPLVVAIPAGSAGPAAPTGVVFNPSNDFVVTKGALSGKSAFLFVGEAGTVSGWSPTVNASNAVTAVDAGASGAVYKGLALASFGGANYLYAANFAAQSIDVYNGSFAKVTLPGAFIDPHLPANYAPFNVATNAGLIYVAYAHVTPPGTDEDEGAGLGIVSLFDTGGNFIRRLVTGGALNAPWGMAFAPADFSGFPNAILIGNFGDGTINAYDATTGGYLGPLMSAAHTPLVVHGLWGIGFGNDLDSQPHNTLFFAAGPNHEAGGQYGRIDAQP